MKFTGSGDFTLLEVKQCTYPIIFYIEFTVNTSSAHRMGLDCFGNGYAAIFYNVFKGTSTTYGHGVRVSGGSGEVDSCYVSNINNGITAMPFWTSFSIPKGGNNNGVVYHKTEIGADYVPNIT